MQVYSKQEKKIKTPKDFLLVGYSLQLEKRIYNRVLPLQKETYRNSSKFFSLCGLKNATLHQNYYFYQTNDGNKKYYNYFGNIACNQKKIEKKLLTIRNKVPFIPEDRVIFFPNRIINDENKILEFAWQYGYGNILQEPEGMCILEKTPAQEIKKIKHLFVKEKYVFGPPIWKLKNEPYKFVGKLWYSDACNLKIFGSEIDKMIKFQHDEQNISSQLGRKYLHKKFIHFFTDPSTDYFSYVDGAIKYENEKIFFGESINDSDIPKNLDPIRNAIRIIALMVFGFPAHWNTMAKIKNNVICYFNRRLFEEDINLQFNPTVKYFFLYDIYNDVDAAVFVAKNKQFIIDRVTRDRINLQTATLIYPNTMALEFVALHDTWLSTKLQEKFELDGEEIQIPFAIRIAYNYTESNVVWKMYSIFDLKIILEYNRERYTPDIEIENDAHIDMLCAIDKTHFTWDAASIFFLEHLKATMGMYGFIYLNEFAVFQELAWGKNASCYYKIDKGYIDNRWDEETLDVGNCFNLLNQLKHRGETMFLLYPLDYYDVNDVDYGSFVGEYIEPFIKPVQLYFGRRNFKTFSHVEIFTNFGLSQNYGIIYRGTRMPNIKLVPDCLQENIFVHASGSLYKTGFSDQARFFSPSTPSDAPTSLPAPSYELDDHDSDDEPILKKRKFDEMNEEESSQRTETETDMDVDEDEENSSEEPATKRRRLE